MNRPTKAQLQALLRGIGVVVFTKVTTGGHRILTCTQNLNLIPKDQWPLGIMHNLNPEILRVYSLKDNDWRSFYVNEVIFAFDPYEKKGKKTR